MHHILKMMLLFTARQLTGMEQGMDDVTGTEAHSTKLSEQAMDDILQSLSELNMAKPGQTLQVRVIWSMSMTEKLLHHFSPQTSVQYRSSAGNRMFINIEETPFTSFLFCFFPFNSTLFLLLGIQ